jgi:hypothetical protein
MIKSKLNVCDILLAAGCFSVFLTAVLSIFFRSWAVFAFGTAILTLFFGIREHMLLYVNHKKKISLLVFRDYFMAVCATFIGICLIAGQSSQG